MNKLIEFFDGDFTFVVFIMLIITIAVITELFSLCKAFTYNNVIPYINCKMAEIKQKKDNNRKAKLASAVNETVLKVIEQDRRKTANSIWNDIANLYM